MDIKELMKEAEFDGAKQKACLNFCLTVCSMLLAHKCETVEEVVDVKEALVQQMKVYQEKELQQLEGLDSIEKMLLNACNGPDVTEVLKALHVKMMESTNEIFAAVVEMKKTLIQDCKK